MVIKYNLNEVIEMLEEIRDNQESVYNRTTFEDYGQIISSAGEMDLLDAISIVKDKIRELETKHDASIEGSA